MEASRTSTAPGAAAALAGNAAASAALEGSPPPADERAVLFSGSDASTLAALRIGETARRVHLLTFVGAGLRGGERVGQHLLGLDRFFGDAGRYRLHRIPVGGIARAVMAHRRWAGLWRHGFWPLAYPELLPVAFHARAMLFCVEAGIRHVADGLVAGRRALAAEEHRGRLAGMYQGRGVTYGSPVLEDGAGAAAELVALRYARAPPAGDGEQARRITSDWALLDRLRARAVGDGGSSEAGEAGEEGEAGEAGDTPGPIHPIDGLLTEKLDLLGGWAGELASAPSASRLAQLSEPARPATGQAA